MSQKKNKFDFASEELRTKYVNDIIAFFHDERGEEIGFIAAEAILDFFLETFGEEVYKKGIEDSKKLLREKFQDLEVELDVLAPSK